MDVGEEDVAGMPSHANIILDVQRELEVLAPIVTVEAVVRKDGIVFQENTEALEILIDAIEHDDVGSNDKEVASKGGLGFIELVEEAPGEDEAEDFGFA